MRMGPSRVGYPYEVRHPAGLPRAVHHDIPQSGSQVLTVNALVPPKELLDVALPPASAPPAMFATAAQKVSAPSAGAMSDAGAL